MCQLRDALNAAGHEVRVCAPKRYADKFGANVYDTFEDWTRDAFESAEALLFVSATGIAVRAIAPYVKDKFVDPAVISIDEGGSFVVPLLSGHVGGANDLAREVAAACGAQAVISTATDVNGAFAIDEWARKQDLAILDRVVAKEVSAAVLAGTAVGFASDFPYDGALPRGFHLHSDKGTDQLSYFSPHDKNTGHVEQSSSCLNCGEESSIGNRTNDLSPCHDLGVSVSLDPGKRPFERTLRLVPRVVTVGVGCKRDTPAEKIAALVDACLEEAHIASQAVCALASIDVKADEAGLLQVADERGWATCFYSAEELAAVPGDFTSSAFVAKTVGVDNVCERAACAGGNTLLQKRRSNDGVTAALALHMPNLHF